MANGIGKILFGIGAPSVNKSGQVGASRGVAQSFKGAPYASIQSERMPQVLDTVPTKDAKGNPLLAGYVTPMRSWVA